MEATAEMEMAPEDLVGEVALVWPGMVFMAVVAVVIPVAVVELTALAPATGKEVEVAVRTTWVPILLLAQPIPGMDT